MGNIKRRIIHLQSTDYDTESLEHTLGEIPGVKEAKSGSLGSLTVLYNLRETNLKSIEKTIEEKGYHLSKKFFSKITRDLIHFTEENESDTMKNRPHSCCSATEGERLANRSEKESKCRGN